MDPLSALDHHLAQLGPLAAQTLAAWLALVGCVEVLASRHGGPGQFAQRLAPVMAPVLVRAAVRTVLGTAGLGLGAVCVAGPAAAAQATIGPGGPDDELGVHRPVVTAPAHPDGDVPDRQRPCAVTVAPGESLWAIAAEHLEARLHREPSDRAVADAWPGWYDRNRARIGHNPHLLVPGTSLRCPR